MTIAELLLPEFDIEIANTRRTLERVPDDVSNWAPHDKSMKIGKLAMHCATIPMLGSYIMTDPDMDMAARRRPQPDLTYTKGELCLQRLDESAAACRAAIASASDEDLCRALEAEFRRAHHFPRLALPVLAPAVPEPSHPPPRPAWGLSPHARHSRPRALRPVRRRADVASQSVLGAPLMTTASSLACAGSLDGSVHFKRRPFACHSRRESALPGLLLLTNFPPKTLHGTSSLPMAPRHATLGPDLSPAL